MGCNYYVVKNVCACCGRRDVEHIGKSSAGWSFSFQATEEIRDFDQWLENVKSADFIEDEYEVVCDLNNLLETIELKRGGKSPAKYNHRSEWSSVRDSSWEDKYGNSFTSSEFS